MKGNKTEATWLLVSHPEGQLGKIPARQPSSALPRPSFMNKGLREQRGETPPSLAHLVLAPLPLTWPWSSCQAQHLYHLARCGSKNNLGGIWISFPAPTALLATVWPRAPEWGQLPPPGGQWECVVLLFSFRNVRVFLRLTGQTKTCAASCLSPRWSLTALKTRTVNTRCQS